MRDTTENVNKSIASTNAYYRVLDFLEGQDEEWTPTMIARELDMPKGTVRWALHKLRERGKVIYRKVGINSFYAATKRFSDEFVRLFKQHKTDNRYEVHGLTLKITGDFANAVSLGGGGCSGDMGVVRWKFHYRKCRVSFQLSRSTFLVYVSCSDKPLDYDAFLLLLSAIDGHLLSKGLPTILDNMVRWKVVQYGFNRDWKRFRNDSPTECVSVQGFSQWFARVYNKKPLGVLREEIHSREEKSLEEFIALVNGSLTSVQVMNFLDILSRNINSLQKSNFELASRVAQLTEIIERSLGHTSGGRLGETTSDGGGCVDC